MSGLSNFRKLSCRVNIMSRKCVQEIEPKPGKVPQDFKD